MQTILEMFFSSLCIVKVDEDVQHRTKLIHKLASSDCFKLASALIARVLINLRKLA